MRPPQFSPALILATGLYLVLAAFTVRSPGLVGEVAASWGLADPPATLVIAEPATWADPVRQPTAGDRIGGAWLALDASQVRPLESVAVGSTTPGTGARLPLAVNTYTGGLPDWPARVVDLVTGSPFLVAVLHVVLGACLIGFAWRVLRIHGAVVGAGAAALWLAGDWSFLFYRKILGGTEIALILASLLVVRGLWDRRWAGGRIAPWAIAAGAGLGLHAKITFAPLLLAVLIAAVATRWDRGAMGAPRPISRRAILGASALFGVLMVPMVIAWAHQAALTDVVRSHDFLGLQIDRALSGLSRQSASPAREQLANAASLLIPPLAFFERSCGADPVFPIAAGRVVGWIVLVAGTVTAWRDHRDRRPHVALVRFLSILVPVAAIGLFAANRDMHHLAQLTGLVALWGGLAVDRVAALVSPPRSMRRGLMCAILLAPWLASGAHSAWQTDRVLATCEPPHLRVDGQRQVVQLLRDHDVERVLTVSYDLYGALDILAPEIAVSNGWGAMSASPGNERNDTLGALLRTAIGGHYLTVTPAAPTIYDKNPSPRDLERITEATGLVLEPVAHLGDGPKPWARLFRVRSH